MDFSRFSLDLCDPCRFPHEKRRHQALLDDLAKEGESEDEIEYIKVNMFFFLGLGESNHFQEIPAETLESLYVLFGVLIELTESRGAEGYNEALAKLPPEYHNNWHQLLQYAAQVSSLILSCYTN